MRTEFGSPDPYKIQVMSPASNSTDEKAETDSALGLKG